MMVCPQCTDADNLDVVVTTWARIVQSEDNVETDMDQDSHEWDETSPVRCQNCNWIGTVDDVIEADVEPAKEPTS